MSDETPELLTVSSAARRLGVAPSRIRTAIRAGELRAFQPGVRAVYVRWPELLEWVEGKRFFFQPGTEDGSPSARGAD